MFIVEAVVSTPVVNKAIWLEKPNSTTDFLELTYQIVSLAEIFRIISLSCAPSAALQFSEPHSSVNSGNQASTEGCLDI